MQRPLDVNNLKPDVPNEGAHNVTRVLDPVYDDDAATKAYVDAHAPMMVVLARGSTVIPPNSLAFPVVAGSRPAGAVLKAFTFLNDQQITEYAEGFNLVCSYRFQTTGIPEQYVFVCDNNDLAIPATLDWAIVALL